MGRAGIRVAAMAMAMAVGAASPGTPARAATDRAGGSSLVALKQPRPVPVRRVAIRGDRRPDAAAAHPWRPATVTWPSPGSARVDLSAASAGRTGGRAGSLPVAVLAPTNANTGAPSQVDVAVADHAAAMRAGVDGMLLSVRRADGVPGAGPVKITVDYRSFRNAVGGDWAARLRLVRLPGCALTTPDKPACRIGQPLATRNDTVAGRLTAQVDVGTAGTRPGTSTATTGGMTVLAATSTSSGPSGSYAATSLQPSGTWSAGGSTGAFTWSYPISAPAVPGDMQPDVSLSYDSQSVDGHTAASNNQPSWVGDGWSYEPGYIERRYKACDDDQTGGTNTTKVGDLCWFNDNATLSLGGRTTELVYDATTGWHPADDSGEKVEKLTDTVNTDNNHEYWKITTTDGTQYFFGRNRLPGWQDTSTPETHSVWTVPVFGNQSGEPCYNASFAAAWCQQAWRWQLDYVVDVHGNAMAYYWNTESNNYGRDVNLTTGTSTPTPYTRGGYLDHIDYGLRSDAVYTGQAMGRVVFGTSERCLSDCGTFDATHAANWPDVPFDQYCKDGDQCTDRYSPTFWSRKRLTSITTKVLTGGAYKNVDSWALVQGFPASGDGISTPMWLSSITRTGYDGAGTALTLPPVTFAGEQLANRVDSTGDGLAPFIRLRVYQVVTETGGAVGVSYEDPDCSATSLPPTDGTNTTRCYEVKWAYEGQTAQPDWFITYPVREVVEDDNLANTPDAVTDYSYLGGAAWAKSTDEFTKSTDRTYSVNRGYGRVQTRTGANYDPRTLAETRYFRGLDGVAVADSAGATVTDREQFAGMVREKATYNGDDTSKLVSATSYTPWRSAPTATRSRADSDLPDLVAYQTSVSDEQTRTTVSTGTRTTSLHRTFDGYGMVATVSQTGDTAKTGDERCTTTSYARNTGSWLLDKVARVQTVDKECGQATTLPDDLIDDVRTYFDGATSLTAAPTKGDATRTERINGAGTGYDTVTSTPTTGYDVYGRALSAADPFGKVTTTAYTPATGEAPTQTKVTNPLAQSATTTVDPLRNQPLTVTDANNLVTTMEYDPLGRLIREWTPARTKASYPTSPGYTFAYTVRNDAPAVVATSVLNYNQVYQTSYAFYDGLLRPFQTQAPSPDDSGRLVAETLYDTRGLVWRNSGTYYTTGAAEAVPVTGQELNYPASTDTGYDGAARVTTVVDKKFGDPVETTTTSYTGDTTTVTPPPGGTATTTVVDALGRTTELKQYTDAAQTASQSTLYRYNAQGRLDRVQDPSGAVWAYRYDSRGRQTWVSDPDRGVTTAGYDAADRTTDVTDARGYLLHTDYDDLGRMKDLTSSYRGASPATLSAWTYDTAYAGKGLPATSTRYVGGQPYVNQVLAYSPLGDPMGVKVTVPGTGGLAGSYQWTTAYYFTGDVKYIQQPAIGGLPSEQVTPHYGYTSTLPVSLSAGSDQIVANTNYDHYGRDIREEYGVFGAKVYATYAYDEHTSALTDQYTDHDISGVQARVDHTQYAHDLAGNVTSITDTTGQDAQAVTDTQCFSLDALRRITEAWTLTSGATCDAGASTGTVGGPDAYWTSYRYDAVGQRTSEVQHATPGGPGTDTTRTYVPAPTGTHLLPQVTQAGDHPHTDAYTYDAGGNTSTRTLAGVQQTLTWDPEGRLAAVAQGATTLASYTYDAQGSRQTGTDATGTTLYLPGGNELLLKPDGTLVGTRYYDYNGKAVAMRTGGKITYLIADAQGTGTTQIDATTQAVTRRRTTIFGAPRGTADAGWLGTKGFVGGTVTAGTGLIHLGARDYDPTIGRFISVDPLLELADPQQLSGYTYASDNPVTFTDPTGLMNKDSSGGACSDKACLDQVDKASAEYESSNPLPPPAMPVWDWADRMMGPKHHTRKQLQRYEVRHFHEYSEYYREVSDWYYSVNKAPQHPKLNAIVDMVNPLSGVIGCLHGDPLDCAGLIPYAGKAFKAAKVLRDARRIEEADRDANRLRRAADAAGDACKNSFTPATPVLMADGSTKPIKDVKVGDKVRATDPVTGRATTQTVTALHRNVDTDLADLTVRNPDGSTAVLHTTQHHPFWDDTRHAWIQVVDLLPGEHLSTPRGPASVIEMDPFEGAQVMRNLTVSNVHTYYVLAGTTPVLVHNTGPNCGTPVGGRNGDYLGGEDFHGSDYSLDEIVEFVNGHTGGGNPVMGRPSIAEVETTLRQAGPRQLEGQNSSRFDHNGVRVIVNWDMPWKSTAYYPGR